MAPLLALLGFVMWMVGLVTVLGSARAWLVLSGKKRSSSFPRGKSDPNEWTHRLRDAHMNCAENLPIFASVVLVGFLAGSSGPTVDSLAWIYLGARVCHSSIHVWSVSDLAINLRFVFLLVQLGCVTALAVMAGFAAIL